MAEEPGPHGCVQERPDGRGRARAEGCTGSGGQGHERGNCHGANGGGIYILSILLPDTRIKDGIEVYDFNDIIASKPKIQPAREPVQPPTQHFPDAGKRFLFYPNGCHH